MREKFLPYGLHDLSDEDKEAVKEVLDGDWITTGPKVQEFENAICSYVNAKYGVAVNSGTSALDIAYAALDLPLGSEVITTPFTFAATSSMLITNRLKPVFADIQKDTYNIDPEKIEEKITNKTKAIAYVDYAGQPCDIKHIKEIAEKHNLLLVEDAAHAIGAEYDGKKVGTFADITEFSFHPVKHITTGEGGLCTTNNEELAQHMRLLRNHGMDKEVKERFGPKSGWSYDIKILGRNYRITDIQCALGISQLKRLDEFLEKRKAIVQTYNEAFESVDKVTTPVVRDNVTHAWHLYTILLDKSVDRNQFFTEMRKRNIGVNVHYIPIYNFTYYKNNLKISPKDYPVTEDVFSRIITLPLFSKMSEEDKKDVISTVKEVLS